MYLHSLIMYLHLHLAVLPCGSEWNGFSNVQSTHANNGYFKPGKSKHLIWLDNFMTLCDIHYSLPVFISFCWKQNYESNSSINLVSCLNNRI